MPKPRRRRIRRTEQEWQQLVQRLEAGGLSAREFCRREGLSLSSLQRRRQRRATPASRFIELTPPRGSAPATASWSVELALPTGITLTLRG